MAVYQYKDTKYKVVMFAKLKNPQTGKWIESVVYQPLDKQGVYVRVQWDFFQKFKKVSYGKDIDRCECSNKL